MPDTPTTSMVVESTDSVRFTEHSQVGRHAPFDPAVVMIPELVDYDWPSQDEWELRLKHGDETTSMYFDDLPFDLVGWKGDLFPLKLNIRDVRPINSDGVHLAPSSWSIFEANSFLCVAFLPMRAVSDPKAEEFGARHRNVDTEELILLRSVGGTPVNALGHFPQGVTHGPGKEERDFLEGIRQQALREGKSMQRPFSDAISIDTFARLKPTEAYLSAKKLANKRTSFTELLSSSETPAPDRAPAGDERVVASVE